MLSRLQCPNPGCPPGTVFTRTTHQLVSHGREGLDRLWYSNRFWQVFDLLLVCWLMGSLSLLLISLVDTRGSSRVSSIAVLLLALLIGGGLGRAARVRRGSLERMELHAQRCSRCRYRWINADSDPATAEQQIRWLEGQLERARARGNRTKIGQLAGSLGGLLITHRGDCAEAMALCREAVELLGNGQEKRSLAYALNNLGFTAIYCDEGRDSPALLEQSVALFRELKDWDGLAHTLNSLATTLLQASDYERARPLLDEALDLSVKLGKPESASWALEGLAALAGASRQPERAACLFGAAEALRSALGSPLMERARPFYERSVAAAQGQIDQHSWSMSWAAGRALLPDQARDFALAHQTGEGRLHETGAAHG